MNVKEYSVGRKSTTNSLVEISLPFNLIYASGSVDDAAPDSSPVFILTSYFVVGPSNADDDLDFHEPADPVEADDFYKFTTIH